MKLLHPLILALLATMLVVACKNGPDGDAHHYVIEGTATGFADGDKLILAHSDGTIIDTIIVRNEAFTYDGATDSVRMLSLYEQRNNLNWIDFFTESGTISISISQEPGQSKVTGGTVNNAWQHLVDDTAPIYAKMQQLDDSLYSDKELSREAQWVIIERYNQLFSEINKKVLESAEKNVDNELGYFLVVNYYSADESANHYIRDIISKMPLEYRQRPAMVTIESKLNAQEATEIGQTTPDFIMSSPTGELVHLMDYVRQHRVTIIDFWASWCGPCRQEMPSMRALYDTYRNNGLGIMGISLDENSDAWQLAVKDLKMEWPQMSDLQGWNSQAATTYNVVSIPFTVVVDSLGTIIAKGLRGDKLQHFIDLQLQ